MLKLLHTADWHVGKQFGQFDEEVSKKLARDRVSVIEQILGRARQYKVDAVLCAGDLFDEPDPGEQWWRAVRELFARCDSTGWDRPVVLLPGNHDPLVRDSVYSGRHPFRRDLPDWVHVVDRDDFELQLNERAVVYAAPCHSKAGDNDLALTLPRRAENDERIRIGLVPMPNREACSRRGALVRLARTRGSCQDWSSRGLTSPPNQERRMAS